MATKAEEENFVLLLTVKRARNLAPKDSNGLSDPYCMIRLSGTKGYKKTKIIKKTLVPRWSETFRFSPVKAGAKLKITCWDDDFLIDDFEGQILIDMDNYKRDGILVSEVLPFKGRGKSNETVTGELLLDIVIVPKGQEIVAAKAGFRRYESILGPVLPISQEMVPKESQLFGVPLTVALSRYGETDVIPSFVQGIFRMVGSHGMVQQMKRDFNFGLDVDLSLYGAHDITSLLKVYLNELPEPLLTFNGYHEIIEKKKNSLKDLDVIKKVVMGIPKENRWLLKEILLLAQKILEHSSVNSMNSQALAICLSPTLVWDKEKNCFINIHQLKAIKEMGELVIDQYDYIFQYEGFGSLPTLSGQRSEGETIFLTYDTNGDGVMDKDEFKVFYHESFELSLLVGRMDEKIEEMYESLTLGQPALSSDVFTTWWHENKITSRDSLTCAYR